MLERTYFASRSLGSSLNRDSTAPYYQLIRLDKNKFAKLLRNFLILFLSSSVFVNQLCQLSAFTTYAIKNQDVTGNPPPTSRPFFPHQCSLVDECEIDLKTISSVSGTDLQMVSNYVINKTLSS